MNDQSPYPTRQSLIERIRAKTIKANAALEDGDYLTASSLFQKASDMASDANGFFPLSSTLITRDDLT